ncbi:DNA-binding HxlR family transcriptional regulator [Mumia flava]|uniref:DNA-binding HxlR family transcriptional regulator n=1 Tax=Mumia flava TaxID=1348852 RepID=A0A0B2BJB7_9ACTN|nr:helix-turn-helix domain-containing protein [Mumia flava]PJJ57333.1 DNA-binding HxlR family transcriptional regulator [Mumia flava]
MVDPTSEQDAPTRLEAGGTNAIGRMLGVLGDEWTLLVLQQALTGVSRYAQFRANLPISNSVLTARLQRLSDEGMLERHVYQTNPLRAEYRITPRSRALWPVMLSIWEWERHWVADRADDLPVMHHDTCGHDFAPLMCCRACGKSVSARDVAAAWGPSGTWERSVPAGATRRRSDSDGAHGQAGLFPDTMTIFGNRWASALMGAAFRGLTRFSDFASALGAPPTLVADRLKAFCALGVLEATENPTRSDWVEYHLTEKGRAFFPVVVASLQWSEHWFVAPEGPALVLSHRSCGAELVATFTCDQCREPLAGHDISIRPSAEGGDLPRGGAET